MRQIILILFLISGLLFGQDSVTISDLPATTTLSDTYLFETESPSTSYKVTWLNMRNEMVNDLNMGLWSRNGLNIYYNTGNVGIGTSTPSNKLHVYNGNSGATSTGFANIISENAGYTGLQFKTPNTVGGRIYWSDPENIEAAIFEFYHPNNYYYWSIQGSERMRIDSDGNVGIGTSTPTEKLEVNGGIITDSLFINGELVLEPVVQSSTDYSSVSTFIAPHATLYRIVPSASGNLNSITGANYGQYITFYMLGGAFTVTFKDGIGNFELAGDFAMSSTDSITMFFDALFNVWVEVSRSNN